MLSRVLFVVRLALVPAFALMGFLLYGKAVELAAEFIPIPKERSLIWAALLTQGFVVATTITTIFAYPLAYVYQKKSAAVALLVCLPVLYLRVPELLDTKRNPLALAISYYEVGAFVILLVGGALLAQRQTASVKP